MLAFRGTEKKISDWLTDARCVRFLKTPVYRIVNSSDIVPRVPPGAGMMGLVLLVQGVSWLTRFASPVSSAFDKLEEFLDKLNGYRHFGDLRYLSDVRIPEQSDHRFRRKLITHSGGNRSPIPAQTDQ